MRKLFIVLVALCGAPVFAESPRYVVTEETLQEFHAKYTEYFGSDNMRDWSESARTFWISLFWLYFEKK